MIARAALIVALITALVATTGATAAAQRRPEGAVRSTEHAAGEARRSRLAQVRSWGYWLRFIDIATVQASAHDLMVLDFGIAANRRFQRARTPEEIVAMKLRTGPDAAGKPPRILLAYLSIGEAERYRPYWRQEWYEPGKAPGWLGAPNPQWDGNWAVRYWDPDWQRLIIGGAGSYLDDIRAQGFDGVYLDRADAFLDWQKERPGAIGEMAAFIEALALEARRRDPGFLVVMQNAEELVARRAVLGAIDGVAKEDLLHGVDHSERENAASDVAWSMRHLRMARAAGRAVLVVEYLSDTAVAARAAARIRAAGFVPYIAPRGLHCLLPPPPASGATQHAFAEACR